MKPVDGAAFRPGAWPRDDDPRKPSSKLPSAANAELLVQAEMLISAYIAPESDRSAIINERIVLFDHPQQREAPTLVAGRWRMREKVWQHTGWRARAGREQREGGFLRPFLVDG
jgi:hypothetical protein